MYSACARKPSDVRRLAPIGKYLMRFGPRIHEVRVAAEARPIHRQRVARSGGREDRVIDRVVDEARSDLADGPLAALADEQRIREERIAGEHERISVERVEVLDLDLLQAVVDEHPRVRHDLEAEDEVAANRRLRELALVANLARVDVDAGGHRPVEEERLGECELIVLRAIALLRGRAERLAAAEEVRGLERQLAEEAVELRHAGAERQLVAVLLFELERDVDLVVGVRRLLDVDGLAFERLEVAELIEALDAVLQRHAC